MVCYNLGVKVTLTRICACYPFWILAHYCSIILNPFSHLIFSKSCQHNLSWPTYDLGLIANEHPKDQIDCERPWLWNWGGGQEVKFNSIKSQRNQVLWRISIPCKSNGRLHSEMTDAHVQPMLVESLGNHAKLFLTLTINEEKSVQLLNCSMIWIRDLDSTAKTPQKVWRFPSQLYPYRYTGPSPIRVKFHGPKLLTHWFLPLI